MTRRRPTSHSYFSQRLRLHYADWGNAAAPHMLLVHGVQDHCHSWDWFADAFADRFHVLAPDLRGHGDSEWVRGSSYHHADYVYDLDQLVRQRNLAPAVVVSHSMGGTLAAMYAGVYPKCVKALVVEDGTYSWKFDNYTHAWPAFRIPEADLVALWQRISCPVLLVNGAEGYPHRIGQDGTLRHFRDVEVIDLPDAGHWPHHDRLDEVVAAVAAFLGRIG
jgi:pimeloyl-ACP methyl ester carboxylesterase